MVCLLGGWRGVRHCRDAGLGAGGSTGGSRMHLDEKVHGGLLGNAGVDHGGAVSVDSPSGEDRRRARVATALC